MITTLLLLAAILGGAACTDVNVTEGVLEEWEQQITEWRERMIQDDIQINKAWITVVSEVPALQVTYLWQHGQCFGCELLVQADLPVQGIFTQLINGEYSAHVELHDTVTGASICATERWFDERGDYWMIVTATHQCVLVLANDPPNVYMPLLWLFLLLAGIAVLWIVASVLYKKGVCQRNSRSKDLETLGVDGPMEMTENGTTNITLTKAGDVSIAQLRPPPVTSSTPRRRLRSLDTFRGFCLVVMIFVNYGYNSHYYFFRHAYWDGALMVADLVFPWFVFIMGTSMAFSFRSLVKKKTPTKSILWKIISRTVKLFAIGIFLGGNPDLSTIRIPGVLQRFSITYLVVALTHLPFAKPDNNHGKGFCLSMVWDVISYWPEWIIMSLILLLHIMLTFFLEVPGCPTGYIGPGGSHDGGQYFNCSGGAALYIDLKIFGENHIYNWPDAKAIYLTEQPFDPEGTLGCLTSIFICYLGLQAGKIIITFSSDWARIIRWIIWGVICCAIGIGLCEGQVTGGLIPINKNLWSVSFIFLLAGMAFIAISLCYLIIDVLQWWNGAPFFYPGMNSIVIYACHSIFAGYFPVMWVMSDPTLHWQRTFMSLWGISVWCLVAFIMYKKKLFVAL